MDLTHHQDRERQEADRVRRSTSPVRNRMIDRDIARTLRRYEAAGPGAIRRRIDELDREWDIERALEVNASALAMGGLVLGMGVDRRWFALPFAVMGFLFQHGVQGWCPPLPVLRRLGFRTRGEIDREKYGLLAML